MHRRGGDVIPVRTIEGINVRLDMGAGEFFADVLGEELVFRDLKKLERALREQLETLRLATPILALDWHLNCVEITHVRTRAANGKTEANFMDTAGGSHRAHNLYCFDEELIGEIKDAKARQGQAARDLENVRGKLRPWASPSLAAEMQVRQADERSREE